MLSSVHEAILHNAMTAHQMSKTSTSFHDWLKSRSGSENSDELSRFWAQILCYLNRYIAYYFALRSGNFYLRNAALPILSEPFFAFGHN